MSQKVQASMADNLEIGAGWQVQLNAVDPTTGANISGVVVSGVVIMAENAAPEAPGDLTSGPFMLVPGPGA